MIEDNVDLELAEQYVIKVEAHRYLIEIMKNTMEAMTRVENSIVELEKQLTEQGVKMRDIDTDES